MLAPVHRQWRRLYQAADDTFTHVSFSSITTTKLRVVMLSGPASYGLVQWVVPSIPATN